MNRSENGAVLIIVLFILAGLAIVSVDMNRAVLLDHAFSLGTRAGLSAKPLLASGESLVARFLVKDFQEGNTKTEQESMAAFNRRFQQWLDPWTAKLKNCDMEISLEDENGRFPLRAIFPVYNSDKGKARLYTEMLERILAALLVKHGYENGHDNARICARRYVRSLLAWGGREILTEEAVKWYLTRKPAYFPPRRPPESLGELLLVWWPELDGELARKTLLGEPGNPGFLENCSLWSRGPINLHTMSAVVGWGFAPDYQRAINFMKDYETARAAQGDALRHGWHRDVFSAHGIPEPPTAVADTYSRWYRAKIRVLQGSAVNSSEAVGWITKTRMTWIARAML